MKYILLVLSLFLLGCNQQPDVEYKTQIVTKTIYKTKIVKVPVYIKPHIPEIHCDFNGTNFEPTIKLLQCVTLQKHILDTIRNQENNTTK